MPLNVHQTKTHLSKLLTQVEQGEEFIISRGSKPIAKLGPIEPAKKVPRVPGRLKGKFSVPDGFFDPLSDQELKVWHGEDD